MRQQSEDKTTDQKLADSFKRLACQHPIDKITIQMITDGAGVIRPTFYNHFQDKYNLLEWILVHDILVPVQPMLASGMMNESLWLIFHNILKEKEFYMHVARLEGQNSFESMVEKAISLILSGMLKEQMKGYKLKNRWLTPEHISVYYAKSMTYVLLSWIRSGMELTQEELTDVYGFIISRSLVDLMRDLEQFEPK